MVALKRMRFKHDLIEMLFVRIIYPGSGVMKFAAPDGEDEIEIALPGHLSIIC